MSELPGINPTIILIHLVRLQVVSPKLFVGKLGAEHEKIIEDLCVLAASKYATEPSELLAAVRLEIKLKFLTTVEEAQPIATGGGAFSVFTRGPWTRIIGRHGCGVDSSQDEQFCNTEQNIGALLVQHDGSLEGCANAELASKAPELLVALKKAIAEADSWTNDIGYSPTEELNAERALVEHFA